MDITHIVISFLAGIAAGFIGSITGGGGLLSIPALIFLGLPANIAIATNRLAAFGIIAAAIPEYQKAKKIIWKTAWRLVPVAIIGGFIGAKTLVHINTNVISVVAGIFLLLTIPTILFQYDKGIHAMSTTRKRTAIGYFLYFLVMLYGGFFGGGAVVLAIYVLVSCFGMTYIEGNATDFIPWLFLSITAFIVYLSHGLVNFELGLAMLPGMYIGGILGSRTALEKGNVWVRGVFIIVVVASSIKLLFFR